MRKIKYWLSFFAACVLVLAFSVNAFAQDAAVINKTVEKSVSYLIQNVKDPKIASVGGEWTIIALAESEIDVPDSYFEKYYKNVEKTVKETNGVLSERKYTEHSRVVLALTAIEKNPCDVGGYNLLTPLGDYEKVCFQGINGPIWALIALDSGKYEMPENKTAVTQASRQLYINKILSSQLSDGGWSLSGVGNSDIDITAMAILALSEYMEQEEVKTSVEKAVSCLSVKQNKNGGFSSYGTENSESISQVITALASIGIDIEDSRFVKNGKTLFDALDKYKKIDGSFSHTALTKSNIMSTEQALCSMVSVKRILSGEKSIYKMYAEESKAATENAKGGIKDILQNLFGFTGLK